MKSEAINELAAALAKAQGEMKLAALDRENPFFHSRYSTLAAVWEACREPLSKNGLSVVQGIERDERGTQVRTLLLHSSGQFIESACPILSNKQDMQSLGSAISYAKRYTLAAMVGICSAEDSEDDDGNKAAANAQKPIQAATSTAKPSVAPLEFISEPQRKRLRAIQGKVKMPDATLKDVIGRHGIESSKEIPRGKVYDAICNEVETWGGA